VVRGITREGSSTVLDEKKRKAFRRKGEKRKTSPYAMKMTTKLLKKKRINK